VGVISRAKQKAVDVKRRDMNPEIIDRGSQNNYKASLHETQWREYVIRYNGEWPAPFEMRNCFMRKKMTMMMKMMMQAPKGDKGISRSCHSTFLEANGSKVL
jgi:hypothetical protein